MLLILVRRILTTFPLLITVTLLVFLLLHFAPGDAASYVAGSSASAEHIEEIRDRLGLKDHVMVQYSRWLGRLAQGDMGQSLFSSVEVTDAVLSRLPVTLWLAIMSMMVAVAISVPLAIIAAVKAGTLLDRALLAGSTLGIATPNFFLGLMLVLVFSLTLDLFPATQYVSFGDGGILKWLHHLILPSIALGAAMAAELARHLRASMRDVLQQDYMRTATSKGLPAWKVVVKHGLKNAAAPVVTVLGLQARALIGGAVVIETVFSLPGLGSLAVNAVFARDLPMIQGIVVTLVVVVLIVNVLVDMSYTYLDPRVRVL